MRLLPLPARKTARLGLAVLALLALAAAHYAARPAAPSRASQVTGPDISAARTPAAPAAPAQPALRTPAPSAASAHVVASRTTSPQAPPAAPAPSVEPPSYAPGQAGMVVGVDPETGRLGPPTPEQRAALGLTEFDALNRSSEGLVEVHHPDGSVSIDLQGRFQEFAVVHMDPAGKPVVECLDDRAAVERALKQAAPAPAKPPVRAARRTHAGRPATEDR